MLTCGLKFHVSIKKRVKRAPRALNIITIDHMLFSGMNQWELKMTMKVVLNISHGYIDGKMNPEQ